MSAEVTSIRQNEASVTVEGNHQVLLYGPNASQGIGEKYRVVPTPPPGESKPHLIPGDSGYAISLENRPWIALESLPMLESLPLKSRPLDIRIDPDNPDLLLLRSDYLPDVSLRIPRNQAVTINPFNRGDEKQEILIGWTQADNGIPYVLFDQTRPSPKPWLQATVESRKQKQAIQEEPPQPPSHIPIVESGNPPKGKNAWEGMDPRMLHQLERLIQAAKTRAANIADWTRTLQVNNRLDQPLGYHQGQINAGMWVRGEDGGLHNLYGDDEDELSIRNIYDARRLNEEINNKGYHKIERDTKINKGVSVGAHPREAIVIDDDNQPILREKYAALKARIGNTRDVMSIMQTVSEFVQETITTDGEAVKQLNKDLGVIPGIDKLVDLAEYIKAGVGVCRHMAVFDAYLVEKLIGDNILSGSVSSDRNAIPGVGAHTWRRFVDRDGTIWISDPTNNRFGTLEEVQALGRWDYARPEEQKEYRYRSRLYR